MNTRDIRRKTPVTLLAASIGLVLSMPSACAQDAAATPEPAGQATELDTVVVTGYRASLERAIDIKRGEVGMVDAIVHRHKMRETLIRLTDLLLKRPQTEPTPVAA